MKIHKEGYISILIFGLFLIILTYLFNYQFPEQNNFHYAFYGLEILSYFLIIRFFRVPNRDVSKDENTILSSADGHVVAIEEVFVDEYLKDKRIQVSVFMSPLNVHINWYPIAGIVKYAKHHAGKHYPAFLPKASYKNEHSSIALQHKNGCKIMIRQIAGSMARRIVFHSKPEQSVEQFDEFGIIKFGSRVDLFLPLDVKINVKLNQKVSAGKNIIAYFK
jgi:phosphatidylserine decarboxylase